MNILVKDVRGSQLLFLASGGPKMIEMVIYEFRFIRIGQYFSRNMGLNL